MAWIVDTCVVMDVLEADPEFGTRSAKLLKKLLPEGLNLCPVTFVELSPALAGNFAAHKNSFFREVPVSKSNPGEAPDLRSREALWDCGNSLPPW